ncbi:UNVERIFIED_CONTAM: hypothetical protein RMT77_008883 [Armadillidium vulgare]
MIKNIILANDSIKLYFSRNSKSRLYEILPHHHCQNKDSLKMNLPSIPNGLHENEDFAWYFFKANKKIFEKFGKQQVTFEKSSVCDHVSFQSISQGNHPYKWKDHPKTEPSRMEYEPQMPSTSRAIKFQSSSRNPQMCRVSSEIPAYMNPLNLQATVREMLQLYSTKEHPTKEKLEIIRRLHLALDAEKSSIEKSDK